MLSLQRGAYKHMKEPAAVVEEIDDRSLFLACLTIWCCGAFRAGLDVE